MSTATEYRDLLVEYLPRPIRSERDYRHALRQLEELMVPRPGAARSQLIEVISTLVEQYESRTLPTPSVGPGAMLAHLLEARGMSRAELARQTGISPATISSALTGHRGISKRNAMLLGRQFNVSPAMFLGTAETCTPRGGRSLG
jgi:HTH-type transcriptional regulator/antitoxin HigA